MASIAPIVRLRPVKAMICFNPSLDLEFSFIAHTLFSAESLTTAGGVLD